MEATIKLMDVNMKKTLSLVGIAIASAQLLLLAGCNTTEGAGKDIKSAGSAIEKSAQDAKK